MYDAPGVGLAANQIGIARRIAVSDAQDELGPRVMVDPELADRWRSGDGRRISLRSRTLVESTRSAFARVEALDLDGAEIEYAGELSTDPGKGGARRGRRRWPGLDPGA